MGETIETAPAPSPRLAAGGGGVVRRLVMTEAAEAAVAEAGGDLDLALRRLAVPPLDEAAQRVGRAMAEARARDIAGSDPHLHAHLRILAARSLRDALRVVHEAERAAAAAGLPPAAALRALPRALDAAASELAPSAL